MASLLRFAPILNFLSHAEVAAAKATDCASLLGYTFSNGTASVVLATDIPQGINFSSSDSLTTYDLPNFCRIALHIQTSPETTATAEVWLPPPDAWNTRLLTVGNGGFAGSSTGGRQGLAALDGVADGVIMGPSRCAFQPETLLCGQKNDTNTNNAAASCLTHDQVLKLERLYRPWLTNDGQILNPGLSPGGEASLATLMNSPEPLFGPAFYRNAVYNDTTWDWRHLSPTDIALGDSVNSGGANAYDPDLRPFEVRGGKVLHYHGCADPLIPSLNAAAWYDEVHRFYADTVGRAGDVEKFYRLFMVPGMGHCSGGAGAWVSYHH